MADDDLEVTEVLDALRCHDTAWLRARHAELERTTRQAQVEQALVRRVLDERDALGSMPDPALSARTARTMLEVGRALEAMPEVAAVALAGDVSMDQLAPLVQLATPETDAEWARRGPRMAPAQLSRLARARKTVTVEEARARREAREVCVWQDDAGMHAGRWRLPDIDGVLVDRVLDHMAERMRPAKGQPWDSLAHRKADALVELCRTYADAEPTGRFRIEVVNILDPNATTFGPEINGIPLAPESVAAILPGAKVRDCVVDTSGVARTVGKPRTALPADVERHVRRRDLQCRVPGCTATRRLQIHHIEEICRAGDTHDVHKLAGVCPHHHQVLEPHGPYRLIGDAEDPDGLTLVRTDDLPDARAGPTAA